MAHIAAKNIQEAAVALWRDGIVIVPSLTTAYFEDIAEGMARLAVDENRFKFKIDVDREKDAQNESDTGLIEREGGAMQNPSPQQIAEGRTHHDIRKITFHMKTRTMGYLLRQGAHVEAYSKMLSSLEEVRALLSVFFLELADELDRITKGAFCFADRIAQQEYWSPVRALHYHCDQKNTAMIARGHYDKCLFTAHIEASRKGYWYLDQSGTLQKMHGVGDGYIVIFLGLKARTIAHKTPIFHGVFDELGPGSGTPRSSLVCFCQAALTEPEQRYEHEHPLPKPNVLERDVQNLFRDS